MASGNMGDLWFNLGIRENVSEKMNRILKAIQKSDGSVSSLIRKMNELLQSMDKKSADKFSKGLEKGIQNGLKYLGMLQQVEQEMEKIRGLKASNKGVNVSGLETAMQQLRQFKGDLLDLQKANAFGGVDNAALGRYSGTLKNILADVKNLERSFDKENSLSAAKNNAARLTNELERVKNKLAEIYSMQSSGMKGGFDTRYLLSAGNSLRGIQRRISSMLGNDDLLLNESKYKSLISDIQFAFTKAAGSIQEYNREKAKANELNREVKAYDKSVEKQAQADAKALSDYAKRYMQLQEERRRAEERAKREGIAAEKQRQAEIERTRARIQSLSHALQNLWSKRQGGRALGLDTSKADEGIRRTIFKLRILKNLLLGLYNGNWTKYLGNLGNMGNGREVSAVNHLASEQAKVNAEKQKAVQLEEKHRQEVVATATRVRSDLVSAFEQARKSASGVNSTVQDLKNLFLQGGLVYGAQQFANSIIQTGGEIVQQHIALRSIIGDAAKADELFKQTQELALQSPFKFGELNRDVKQLAAFGVEANELYETTKRLADISSGLGVSFERLGLAYGQVKARSWLDGKELRQFAYAGLPLLKSIAELYNSTAKNGKTDYTEGDIKKMISQREVSFDDVKQVLWGLTDEGGKFYNMQFVLSDTLLGKWNKLIDAWDIMLGRFAEGKNVIGGTFKFIIDSVTSLVLMIDKFSPALLAFGGMLALRKGAGAIASKTGIASELTALRAAQQLELRRYMVEQNRLVLEGQITREQATQNIMNRGYLLADTQTKMNAMEKLAIEGKLSLLQMQKAVREGLISKELIKQLEIMGLISAKQSELITKEGAMARIRLAANQGMGKLGGFFSGWNLATLGVTIGMAMYSAYSSFKEKIKQESDQINENAKSNFKALSETLSEVSPKADYGGDLQAQVDKMKEVLEQSGLYTDTIKEQIDNCNDLNKEYDILKQKIIEAKEASGSDSKFADAYAEAKAATGAPWYIPDALDQNIDENTDDMAKALTSLQLKIENFSDATKAAMDKTANSMLGAKAAGMTFEEKLGEIARRNRWAEFANKVSNGNNDVKRSLLKLSDDVSDFGSSFGQITNDDIPKYLESMRKSMGMSQTKFAEWCRKNPVLFKSMLDQMLSEANKKVPGLVARLQQIARSWYNLATATPKPSNIGPKVWKNPLKVGTVERTTFDKLYKNGKLSGGKGGFWQKEMAEFIKSLNNGKSSGWYDFGEVVRTKYRDVRNENDSAKSAGQAQPMYRQQKMLEAIAAQNGINLDVGKSKVTGNFGKNKSGRQEDKELEALRNEISLYKTYYTELQKYRELYGKGAEEVLKGSKDFAPVYGYNLPNLSDYGQSVRTLVDRLPKTTADRKAFADKAISDISSKDRSLEEKNIDDVNSALREKLNLLSEEYDTYKKLYELTGDRNSSMRLAFGGKVQSETMKEYLANEMKKALPEANKRSGQKYTADEVLAMSEADFKTAYGEKSEKVSEIFYKYRDELKKVQKETIDLMTRLVQENATIDQQIADLDRNHERNVALINGDKNMSPEFKTRALAGEDKSYNDKRSSLRFEQFKQSTDWVKVFDDLDRVSNETIDEMIKGIDKFSKEGNLSVEVVKQLREALSKLRKENMERNPFDVLMNTTSQANAIGSFLRDKNNKTDKDGKYTVSEAQGKKMGLNAGKYTKADLEGEQRGKYSDFTKTIGVITQKFKALEAAMEPIATLFDNLGVGGSGLKEVFDAAGNALSAASNMSGAMDTLSQLTGDGTSGLSGMLAGAGPYAAAAAAGISMINSIAAKHDEALQKEIEASKERQKEMENLSKNVQWEIDNILGGVYNFTSDKMKDKFQQVLDKYNSTNEFNKHFEKHPSLQQKNYSDKTAEAVKESIANPYSAFAAQRAALMVQRDELEKQLKAEEGKKKSSSSAIADYKQQITELNQEIDAFTDEWAKKIYDIDLKSWAKEFTDVIVDAWAKGEDAVDAYKDKVKEVMNSLAKNIIAQSVLEIAFEPVQEMLREKLKENNGKLKTTDIAEIGKELDTALGNSVDNVTGLLDELKSKGWDLSENGSLSVSNSIKGVTEETADLLASYINAIRLDVSVNRANIEQMVEAVKKIPNLTVIAQSQLTQLNTLVSLAQSRNEKLDMMYDWMKATTNGTKKISVA